MSSRCDVLVREIHALATLRHLEVDPHGIGVHLRPLRPGDYPKGVQVPGPTPSAGHRELGEACHWEAQVRLGGGRWSHDSVGVGATPEEALESLRRGFGEIHRAIDERRAALAARVGVVGTGSMDGPAYKAGRVEGRADTVTELRAILDPTDAHKWDTDGVMGEVARLGPGGGAECDAKAALLDELMEQAQHTTGGGQVWALLEAKREALGMPPFGNSLPPKPAPDSGLPCCHLTCDKPATHDVGPLNGPGHDDRSHACTAHVGALLPVSGDASVFELTPASDRR